MQKQLSGESECLGDFFSNTYPGPHTPKLIQWIQNSNWTYVFNGHESEKTLGDSEGHGSLAC